MIIFLWFYFVIFTDEHVMLLPNGAKTLEETIYIDSTKVGNEARFINHTCNTAHQNVRFQPTYRDSQPVLLVEVTKDTKKGDTLLASYVNTDRDGVRTVFHDFQEECRCQGVAHHIIGTNAEP